MKRISDYKDGDAFELLADLFEPVAKILADKEIKELWHNGSKIDIAKYILKNHKSEAMEIFRTIDSEMEITPVSVLRGIVEIATDIEKDPALKDFFRSAERENEGSVISGSAMENIKDGVN